MTKGLRAHREMRGLSVAEVATLTGVKPQTYYKYESGTRTPRREVMAKIASVLGASIEAIFFADMIDNESRIPRLKRKKGA